jgi:hypothetical protein
MHRSPSFGLGEGQTPQLQLVPICQSLHEHVTAPYVQLIVATFGSVSQGSVGRGWRAGHDVQFHAPFSQPQVWVA